MEMKISMKGLKELNEHGETERTKLIEHPNLDPKLGVRISIVPDTEDGHSGLKEE